MFETFFKRCCYDYLTLGEKNSLGLDGMFWFKMNGESKVSEMISMNSDLKSFHS